MMRKCELEPEWRARAADYARRFIDDLAARPWQRSRSYSMDGIESDWSKQWLAKCAEIAFALLCDLDPRTAVRWTIGADDGADILFEGLRYDVKHTPSPGRCLIWPISKNEFLDQAKSDRLVLVLSDSPLFWICGWITKKEFCEKHHTAPAGPYGNLLWAGTKFLHGSELHAWPEYDAAKDFAGSLAEGYKAIRERQANGGPGWTPKA